MAKIKWSGLGVTEARGAAGADIFSRNNYGNYVKANVSPTNPNTPAQQAIRNAYATVSGLWSTLSDDERNEWNHYSKQLKKSGRVNGAQNYTGQIAFISYCINVLIAGALPSPLPPPILRPQPLTSFFTVSCDVSGVVFGGTYESGSSVVPIDECRVIYASPMYNPGRMKLNNTFRAIESANAGADWDLVPDWTQYNAIFPAPVAGAKIFFRVQSIHAVSGLRSPIMWTSAIVQP